MVRARPPVGRLTAHPSAGNHWLLTAGQEGITVMKTRAVQRDSVWRWIS
jgi:hypothetical protein